MEVSALSPMLTESLTRCQVKLKRDTGFWVSSGGGGGRGTS